MSKRLNRMGIVLIKNFLSVNEAARLHGLTQKELLELAYPIGAVYEINGRKFRLINEKILRRFMDKKDEMSVEFESDYVPYAQAEKKAGFPPQVFRQIAYRAKAVYQIETVLYVNPKQIDEYLVHYRKKLNY